MTKTYATLHAALISAVLLAGSNGQAAATQLAAGSIELAPTVSFSHSNFKREGYGNTETFTRLDFTPTVGFCLNEHYEITTGLMARHTAANDESDTALGAMAGFTYNFSPQGAVIPFASVGFGALFYDGFSFDGTAVLAPMITAGVRMLVGSSASVNLSLGYQHESNAEGEFNASSNRIVAGVGVSIFPWQK